MNVDTTHKPLHVSECRAAFHVDIGFQMIGDVDRVLNMLVGDTQKLEPDHLSGAGILQRIPNPEIATRDRLAKAAYSARLIHEGPDLTFQNFAS